MLNKNFDKLVAVLMEKCWKGYTQKGMKKKGKKMVPNCVKVKKNKRKSFATNR